MHITLPELSLVLLIGVSGCGKSTFARQHFKPTEVLSSDYCRALVADDENDQTATPDAFEILNFIARKRLAAGRLTVIDATNVQVDARKSLITLARDYHVLPVAIVLNLPEQLSQERNHQRTNRTLPRGVIHKQQRQLDDSLPRLKREGFNTIVVLSSPAEVDAVTITRQPLWTNRKQEHGPFDIIGDIHGCADELLALLHRLGYQITPKTGEEDGLHYTVRHSEGRRVIFLGDLVDRGPNTPGVLRLAMDMEASHMALCVPGNHDIKLLRKLHNHNVHVSHGLEKSLEQLGREPPAFIQRVTRFLEGLVSHYVLDDGKLVVAHAGMPEAMQGRASRKVYDFALYGETTGEADEFGLPVRYQWTTDYRGAAIVVYGHTPVVKPEWLNHTINIDTGCVFGGRLTALRYPEQDLISVAAAQVYSQPARPLRPPSAIIDGEILDITDVLGKRTINTRLMRRLTIREAQTTAALEVMSRFAINPRWLIYLPPAMAPTETSQQPDLLEHPAEAFAYYQNQHIDTVICQEKHMGSRMVMVVCRNAQVARERFNITDPCSGVCYTRTGRPFFDDPALESALLTRVQQALDTSALWDRLKTDWVCLDGELLPWSAKAHELLHQQFAAVSAAAGASLSAATAALEKSAHPGVEVEKLLERFHTRAQMVQNYTAAYRRYCWPVQSIADLRFAPFHLLASEGAVHMDKDHIWHMQTLSTLCQADPTLLLATSYRVVTLDAPPAPDTDEPIGAAPSDTAAQSAGNREHERINRISQEDAIHWWEELIQHGGEGIVIKPLAGIVQSQHGLVQPALKCRGREYLRIIYGPEYTMPEMMARLRSRNVQLKRSLALREFALGIEALERFVQRDPLYRVHECVFAILALESEPVDPRL